MPRRDVLSRLALGLHKTEYRHAHRSDNPCPLYNRGIVARRRRDRCGEYPPNPTEIVAKRAPPTRVEPALEPLLHFLWHAGGNLWGNLEWNIYRKATARCGFSAQAVW